MFSKNSLKITKLQKFHEKIFPKRNNCFLVFFVELYSPEWFLKHRKNETGVRMKVKSIYLKNFFIYEHEET